MERRINEEGVTKCLLELLEKKGWVVVSYDYPQSGTGTVIHPNNRETKNKGSFIPDIVAYKGGCVLFFENKDRFVYNDFLKVELLRTTDDYSNDICALLSQFVYDTVLYGVGMPYSAKNEKKTKEFIRMVDFAILLVEKDQVIQVQDCAIEL